MEERRRSRVLPAVALAVAMLLLSFGAGWLGSLVGESSTSGPGPAGIPGTPGANGADGADGVTGTPGADGADGAHGADGARGPAGPVGPRGAAGPQGAAGAPGADGQDGNDGKDGQNGANGQNGAPGLDATSLTGLYAYSDDDDFVATGGLVLPFTAIRDIDGVEPTSLGGPPGSPDYALHIVDAGYYRFGMSATIRTTVVSNATMLLRLTYVSDPGQAFIEDSAYGDERTTRMSASGLVHLQADDYVRFALVPQSLISVDSYQVIFTVEKLG
jgi:hypothetical protein